MNYIDNILYLYILYTILIYLIFNILIIDHSYIYNKHIDLIIILLIPIKLYTS